MLLKKKDLPRALQALDAPVYVPAELEHASRFTLYDGGAFEPPAGNTALPPKDILFPGTQKMYAYRLDGRPEVTEFSDSRRRVVF
ncbi:MAG: hypothetical protein Q4C13_06735, partial [Clostridia bacterium]|nr:hypothetical protein [Clostridia bacterium]